MEFFKNGLRLLWRAWFYIFMFITIIIMSPALLILVAKESYYPTLFKMLRIWSRLILFAMGFSLEIEREQETDPNESYMFCANHTSFMDIFILMAITKNPIVFVGKKELVKIPVFGFFYKRIAIMVDRSSPESRRRVYKMAKQRLKNGTSIAIYPEGLVPEEDVILAPFKKGAFSLAIEQQIPIVPHIYYDCKRLFSWNIYKGHPGKIRVKQLKFIETKGLTSEDLDRVKDQLYNTMYEKLSTDELYVKN